MSIRMIPGAARLTILGSGWSNSSVESGDGFTEDGKLWEDVAGDLGYDFGDNVDWDQIAGDGIDWSDTIYVDEAGTIYTDPNGSGIWTNPETGEEYSGNGSLCLSEEQILEISNNLEKTAQNDSFLMSYAIDAAVLKTLYGGKVSEEHIIVNEGSDRPHKFSPPVYFIQVDWNAAVLFLDEPFYHSTANGGSLTIYDEAITIRDGSTKSVYWSDCTTLFTEQLFKTTEYYWMPIQYVCWQCLHGSFYDTLVSSNEDTITSDDIKNGTAGLPAWVYGKKTYYAVN